MNQHKWISVHLLPQSSPLAQCSTGTAWLACTTQTWVVASQLDRRLVRGRYDTWTCLSFFPGLFFLLAKERFSVWEACGLPTVLSPYNLYIVIMLYHVFSHQLNVPWILISVKTDQTEFEVVYTVLITYAWAFFKAYSEEHVVTALPLWAI